MHPKRHTYQVDYGHLAFLALMLGSIIWYFFDAVRVSATVNNLLLIAPLAIFSAFLALIIAPQCLHRIDAVTTEEAPDQYDPLAPKLPTERRQILRMVMLGGALGAFVVSLAFIGFDIAIFMFAIASMAICGERRLPHLLCFSAVVTVVAIYGFRALMPYPMFTMLL